MSRYERSSVVFETSEVAGKRRIALWKPTNSGNPMQSASRCAPAPALQMACHFRGTDPRCVSRLGSSAAAGASVVPRRSCAVWQSEAREHHRINGLVLSYLRSGKLGERADRCSEVSTKASRPERPSGATHRRPSAAAMRPATGPLACVKRFWQNNFRRKQQWNQCATF